MGLNTLLGQVSPEKIQALPGKIRNPDRIKQHIDAFALHLQGVSYRGIQDHFGWKSLSTAQNSVRRGEELARNLNLDSEKIRLRLAAFFDEILDITLAQVKEQATNGQLTLVSDNQGNETITRRRGVDPRLLGEAGRGAIRFAQFVGLMDSDKATSGGAEVSTNVVFINPQADLSEWETKTVDVTPNGPASGPALQSAAPEVIQRLDDNLPVKEIMPDLASDRAAAATPRAVQQRLFG